MRLVDLEVAVEHGISFELHPRLTMIVAPAPLHERLAAQLSKAFVLAGTEVTGTVDGGGFLTPFDPTAVVALDLVGDGLRVVGPNVLPPPDPTPRRAAREQLVAQLDHRRRELRSIADERGHVERLAAATTAAITAGTSERDECSARLTDLMSTVATLDARPAALSAERSAATNAADVANARLVELRALRAELATVLGPSEDGATIRMGDDLSVMIELVDRAGTLGAISSEQQAELQTWCVAVAASSAPIRDDAKDLIAQVEGLDRAWQRVAQLGIEGAPAVARLVSDQHDLVTNQRLLADLAASGLLGDTAKSHIDAAHIAVLQAPKSEQAAAVADEQTMLARYGFDSYLEYTIATSTRSLGQAVQAKLDELDAAIAQVGHDLGLARTTAATEIERLAAEREPAQERVTALLGYRPAGSSVGALCTVPSVPHAVTRLTLTVDEAIELAQDEMVRYREVQTELDDEGQTVVAQLGELHEQRDQLAGRLSDLDEVIARAITEREVLVQRQGELDRRAAEVTTLLAECGVEIDRIDGVPTDRYHDDDLPLVVDAVVSVLGGTSSGSDPVVMSDTLAPMGELATAALEEVARQAEQHQVLYLTSDPAMRTWAKRLDPTVGALVDLGPGRWSPRRLGARVLGRRQR